MAISQPVKICEILMSFLKARVSFLSNFASIFSVLKHNARVLLSSNILYFVQKRPIKVQMFDILERSAQNPPRVNFELISQFLFKFCIILYFHDT